MTEKPITPSPPQPYKGVLALKCSKCGQDAVAKGLCRSHYGKMRLSEKNRRKEFSVV